MGSFSIWHWLIVLAVVLVLFGGGGKISRLMGDFGKGLKSFKKGMKEDGEDDGSDSKKEIDSDKSSKPEVPAAETGKSEEKDETEKDKAANG